MIDLVHESILALHPLADSSQEGPSGTDSSSYWLVWVPVLAVIWYLCSKMMSWFQP